MKARNFLIASAIISMSFLVGSCHKSNNNDNSMGTKISISGTGFSPASLTVSPGSTVTWNNNDTTTHSVATMDGSINSGDIAAGASYSKTFATAGTFDYHDAHNTNMTGVLIIATSSGSGY